MSSLMLGLEACAPARYGFLPIQPPLQALESSYYQPWEEVCARLPSLISRGAPRAVVENLPVISTKQLRSKPEWRRAYVLLTFMVQGYTWEIPPCLSIPLLEIAAHVELPPAATYAGYCLWNYRIIDPEQSSEDPHNLASLVTFTGTEDEEWFYLTSVAIEARGGRTRRQGRRDNCLKTLADELHGVGVLLSQMRERCRPHVFYHRTRPLLNGSKNMAANGLPQGVIYNVGSGNAQSSLIQLFDMAMGVEHESSALRFIVKMRQYMPGEHRRFMEKVAAMGSVREFVKRHSSDGRLMDVYHGALRELRGLRDIHLRIVSQYIVAQSSQTMCTMDCCKSRTREHSGETLRESGTDKDMLRGTGGTPLVQYLKRVREGVSST
ncbi:Indoleamine 2,3-dioxygenase [Aspergillus taichungensis]|uniref:Indoleamine 2,3-dioxygenase n=1 Tax=Aspergillus taichungensis TaxID=482145 RepID=A0A2J5I9W2_9EURO|nr:Indoleamine 2,3-dioxygenase [Aspergillus taichungensis]